jgi:hypothetical protein
VLQKVIGMAVRAGMLFAALSLAKTSPHRRPVEMLLVRIHLRVIGSDTNYSDGLSSCYWYACTFGAYNYFGGAKQHEWIADMAVGPTRTLQLCCSERRPSRHGVSTSRHNTSDLTPKQKQPSHHGANTYIEKSDQKQAHSLKMA